MKTAILLIIMAGVPDRAFLTQDCGQHIRALSVQMPAADLYCLTPSYDVRPQARPEGLGL